jgi:hypothetical protein
MAMISHCLLFIQLLLVAWMVDAGLDVHDDFAIRPRTITCRNPYGNEPDPVEKCSHWFYQCDGDSIGQLSLCQENLYYDWVQMECDHFTSVPECTGATRGPIRTTIMPRVTTIDQTLFDCTKAEDGNYADQRGTTINGKLIPYCSNRFFTCTNGILIGKNCQSGYFYDQTYDWCGSLDQVFACNGGIRVTPPPTTLATRATTQDFQFDCSNKKNGNYPDPLLSCSQYYISCSDGRVAGKLRCASATYYNPESLRCEDREAVFACTGVRLTTLRPQTFYTVAPYYFNCTGLVNGRMYNNPDERCGHTFFQCSNGIGVKETCADSTYFDYESQTCLVREHVFECTGIRRPSTTYVPTLSTRPPYYFNCTGLKDGGMYPNPLESCSHIFYECSNGFGWQKYCAAESTYFDVYSQSCNYKKYVPACTGLTRPMESTTTRFTFPEQPSTRLTPEQPITRFTIPDQPNTRSHRPARLRTTTGGKVTPTVPTVAPTTSSTQAPTEEPLLTSTITHGKARLRTTTSHPTPPSTTTTVITSSHGPARLRTTSEDALRSTTGRARPRTSTTLS